MPQDEIVIRPARVFAIMLLVLAVLWAMGGGMLTYVFWLGLDWRWGLGFLAASGFGALVLGAMGYMKIKNRGPVLIVNATGFVDCRQGAELVPWTNVGRVEYENTTLQGGDFYAVLHVTVIYPHTGMSRKIPLRVDHLDWTSDQIWNLFGHYCGAGPTSDGSAQIDTVSTLSPSSTSSARPRLESAVGGASSAVDERESCYLCGKRLNASEMPRRVCQGCLEPS